MFSLLSITKGKMGPLVEKPCRDNLNKAIKVSLPNTTTNWRNMRCISISVRFLARRIQLNPDIIRKRPHSHDKELSWTPKSAMMEEDKHGLGNSFRKKDMISTCTLWCLIGSQLRQMTVDNSIAITDEV